MSINNRNDTDIIPASPFVASLAGIQAAGHLLQRCVFLTLPYIFYREWCRKS